MGNPSSFTGQAPVHLFASATSWIEGAAVDQLHQVAGQDTVSAVAGMPDLHPGKYGPVGCAIRASHVFPQFVGSDIGCGMALFRLDIAPRKLKLDVLEDRISGLDEPWDGDIGDLLQGAGLEASEFDAALGSIGGGNHFCEFQTIDEIVLPDLAEASGLERGAVYMLVHSGSRGLGASILEPHLRDGLKSLAPDDPGGQAYLSAHDHAVAWARLNRFVVAKRASEAAKAELTPLMDVPHNYCELLADGSVLHRKGAAPADRGLVPVPGSRGTLSYVMAPRIDASDDALQTLAHGAGRKHDRAAMHGRIPARKSDVARLQRNGLGGRVVCADRDLIVEEAPEAYKNIGQVISDLTLQNLATTVATFKPLLTFKTAKARGARGIRESRSAEMRKGRSGRDQHSRDRSRQGNQAGRRS